MKITDEYKIILEINERMQIAEDGWKENIKLALDDVHFRNGEQWPEKDKSEREKDGRPCLTFNRIPTFIKQVTGDQRIGKPSIGIHPADVVLDEKGEEQKIKNVVGDNDYEYAQVMDGLIKDIEYQSRAIDAYSTAFDNAVGNGFGYWRIMTEYEKDGFNQCIRIKRIANPFRVRMDPTAEGAVKEDAKWCFIDTWVDEDEYESRYGKDKIASIKAAQGTSRENWYTGKMVRIAEYYRRVRANKTIALLDNGAVYDLGEDEKQRKAAEKKIGSMGLKIVKERETDCWKVQWMKTDGFHILSKKGEKDDGIKEVASSYIPVIFVPGEELNIEGETIYSSIFRHAKDAQRNYNYWRTAATEQVALAPKAPYIGPASAFIGYENAWKLANRKNYGYLPFNDDAPMPPQRQVGPQMPQGAMEEAQAADMDLKGTIGIFGAGLGEPSQEASGRAILARQREGDVGSYVYHDNLAKAMEHSGRILAEMIPKIYDTKRVIRIRNEEQDIDDMVEINVEDENGRKLYDLGAAKYDIRVKTGPSFTTQRLEAAEAMMEMTRQNPMLWGVLGDLIASNMDWPGADEMAERIRKTMDQRILSDEENPEITEEMVVQLVQQAKMETQNAFANQLMEREMQIKEFDSQTKRMGEMTDKFSAEMKALSEAMKSVPDEEKIKDIVAQGIAELLQSGGM